MSRRGIGRAIVVEEAARLADEKGLEGLALSDLADRLGIRSPSLYNHVAGLSGLRRELSLLAARILGEAIEAACRERSGREAVLAAGDEFRKLARVRPGLYACLVQAPAPDDAPMREASARLLEPLFRVLAASGCEGEEAIHAVRALRAAVHGFALLESAGGFGLPTDLDDSFRWMVGRIVPERNPSGSA